MGKYRGCTRLAHYSKKGCAEDHTLSVKTLTLPVIYNLEVYKFVRRHPNLYLKEGDQPDVTPPGIKIIWSGRSLTYYIKIYFERDHSTAKRTITNLLNN